MSVTAPRGFRAAGVAAGLKANGARDVALVVNDAPPDLAAAAAVFTTNRFAAAPVRLCQERLAGSSGGGPVPRAVVLNSGGANACTGQGGYADAAATAEAAARWLGLDPREVLVCSTGLIGERLPMSALLAGVEAAAAAAGGGPGPGAEAGSAAGPGLAAGLVPASGSGTAAGLVPASGSGLAAGLVPASGPGTASGTAPGGIGQPGQAAAAAPAAPPAPPDQGGLAAAEAIMTTDTRPKEATRQGASGAYTSGGMAKGAGMLAPELATMLVVLTTDALVDPDLAQSALETACAHSFNRVDSDGCMSTNDTVILLASGASGVAPDPREFAAHLTDLCQDLALQLVADAEGASHEIAVEVAGALTEDGALAVARAIARSNLFKTAIAGNDPNWGRILAAAGTVGAPVAPFDPDQVDVQVNGVTVARQGGPGEPRERVDLSPRRATVRLDLHAGAAAATVWTNDLTHEYVSINADYSS